MPSRSRSRSYPHWKPPRRKGIFRLILKTPRCLYNLSLYIFNLYSLIEWFFYWLTVAVNVEIMIEYEDAHPYAASNRMMGFIAALNVAINMLILHVYFSLPRWFTEARLLFWYSVDKTKREWRLWPGQARVLCIRSINRSLDILRWIIVTIEDEWRLWPENAKDITRRTGRYTRDWVLQLREEGREFNRLWPGYAMGLWRCGRRNSVAFIWWLVAKARAARRVWPAKGKELWMLMMVNWRELWERGKVKIQEDWTKFLEETK